MKITFEKARGERAFRRYLGMMRNNFSGWCGYTLRRLLLLSCILYILSVTSPYTRLVYIFTFGWVLLTVGVCGMRLAHRRRWCFYVFAGVILGVIVWARFADRAPDTAHLRRMYRACLYSYRGTVYIWGGETHVGIDCSGLARTALCDALALEGLREGNPHLLGPSLWHFWWRDLSARAMGTGAYHYTRCIGAVRQLADLDYHTLEIGDLAVTESGDHVLIYVGDNNWIEANPTDGGVGVHQATRCSQRPYFRQPMTLHRWRFIE